MKIKTKRQRRARRRDKAARRAEQLGPVVDRLVTWLALLPDDQKVKCRSYTRGERASSTGLVPPDTVKYLLLGSLAQGALVHAEYDKKKDIFVIYLRKNRGFGRVA